MGIKKRIKEMEKKKILILIVAVLILSLIISLIFFLALNKDEIKNGAEKGELNNFLFWKSLLLRSVQDVSSEESNLVLNPGFEDDFMEWRTWPNTESYSSIETSGCKSGKCLKIKSYENNANSLVQGIYLERGETYWITAWFKASPEMQGSIGLFDYGGYNWNCDWWSGNTQFRRISRVNDTWIKIGILFKPGYKDCDNKTVLSHNLDLYLFAIPLNSTSTNDSVYYDNISIVKLDTYPIGCLNDENQKCFDFADDESQGSFWTMTGDNFMSEKMYESEANFRRFSYSLIPSSIADSEKKSLFISIPAFNIDEKGFPLTPMMLEVRLRDNSYQTIFSSMINFSNDDVKWKDIKYLDLFNSLQNENNNWKNIQYIFQKTPFQVLRAFNGNFIIKISLPNNLSSYVDLDYITLKSISDSEVEERLRMQREIRGYYEIPVPPDKPLNPVNYDLQLSVFIRDIMHPIYKNTKPKIQEIDKPIFGFSSTGETEALSFGLYSKTGISNLTFDISDLILNKSNPDIISKENIIIQKVAYHYLDPNMFHYIGTYLYGPDHLEDFNSLSIDAGTSERIWIKINIPENISGGNYTGNIKIQKDGQLLKIIPISLEIIPIILEHAKQINYMYSEPDSDQNNQYIKMNEIFKVYKETNIDSGIFTTVWAISCNNMSGCLDYKGVKRDFGEVIDITDRENFENKIDDYIRLGIIHKGERVITSIPIWYSYGDVYGYTGSVWPNASDKYLYYSFKPLPDEQYPDDIARSYKPNAIKFEKIFKGDLRILEDISKRKGIEFIYIGTDEPCLDYYSRIINDRMFTLAKEAGVKTMVSYTGELGWIPDSGCVNDMKINSSNYTVPNQILPAWTDIIDYKMWPIGDDGYIAHSSAGFQKPYQYYGQYHTEPNDIIYNRFYYGLLAERENLSLIGYWAFSSVAGDPYNDFDNHGKAIGYKSEQDWSLVYPTWTGKSYPKMSLEGLREGIKDAKYIATLQKLIKENPGTNANQAKDYLNSVMQRISPYYNKDYVQNNFKNDYGFSDVIVKDVSPEGNEKDYESFTEIRKTIAEYIKLLAYSNDSVNIIKNITKNSSENKESPLVPLEDYKNNSEKNETKTTEEIPKKLEIIGIIFIAILVLIMIAIFYYLKSVLSRTF